MPEARLERTRATLPAGYQFPTASPRGVVACPCAQLLPAADSSAIPYGGVHCALHQRTFYRGPSCDA